MIGEKSVLAAFLITLGISGFWLASVASGQSSFKVSGYVLDSTGHGIGGAMIIFGVPSVVPSVYSDSSGHYVVSAPAGTYHVNVWPPFDSNFIYYDQPGFAVGSDITKNITLVSGYKVSGYILDSSGKPVPKAVVSLNNFLCGWYSNYSGYYFVTAPAGTYTLSARPANGPRDAPNFPTYYEYNFVVNGNIAKNITVGSTALNTSSFKISGYILDANGHGIGSANIIFNVPSFVPSVYSDSSGHYVISAPAGTYHVNVWPPYDSNYINYDEPGFAVGSDMTKNITLYSGYKVSGYISNSSGKPVTGAVVLLNNFGSGWFSNSIGYYFLSVPAGTYTINAHPGTGYNYSGPTTSFSTYYEHNFTVNSDTIKNITVSGSSSTPSPTPMASPSPSPSPSPTPSPPPARTGISISTDQNLFHVESNSTVSALAFNSTSSELSFVVSGPNGTEGYVKATIAKSLVSNADYIKVYLDGNQLDYEVISQADSWHLSFTYRHSTHRVNIDLAVNAGGTKLLGIEYWTLIVVAIITAAIGTSLLVYFKKRKHKA